MNSPLPTAEQPAENKARPGGLPAEQETVVRDAFDDVALVVGGVAVLHNLDDDLIWTVMKRLDRIRVRLLRNLKGATAGGEFEPNSGKAPRTHAAVDEFLFRNRVRMGE
ncbi:MAG: hypothetical protein IT167_18580 [Bryobacterales bacterium]|nr:hypothetical protein [Bryobacterales bacterium]